MQRFSLSFALYACLAACVAADSLAEPLKVMPLGDSITAGDSDGDYRTRLWQRFGSDPTKVDFIGSLLGGPPALGDRDHEGHVGYSIARDPSITFGNLTDNITRWLPSGRGRLVPDVILLMIGTNDINYNAAESPTAPDRLSHLISLISDPVTGRAPTAKLIVSSILPIDDTKDLFRATPGDFSRNARVQAFNAVLPAVVAAHRAAGGNVFFVDINARFAMSDIRDGLHPTRAGYERLGDAWYDAIQSVLLPEPGGAVLAAVCLGALAHRSRRRPG